jgi:beta-phosphoglucomutase family hydrolase
LPNPGSLTVVLGLPDDIRVCLFDLDGVLTDTASVHRAAWGAAFDPVLQAHGQPRFSEVDYEDYVDGKSRLDGVRDFLAARGVALPAGGPGDPPDAETVHAIAERKNADVIRRIRTSGVTVFPGSLKYVQAATAAGLGRVVVSSSANTADVLAVTGLGKYIDGRIDGVTIKQAGMPGKPAPDAFLAGARLAGVAAQQAAVFEDATAGVEAGRRGDFGFVVGVNRHDAAHEAALRAHGADLVVRDLAALL